MTREERLAVTIACKALMSGAEPALVVEFLEQIIGPITTPTAAEILRPGGAQ